jgi:hypothetical protein
MADKIRAKFIFEILGRPPEHIKTTLGQFIDKLEEIKEVKIEERIVHEPKLIEDEENKGLYSTFAEVELTTETLAVIVDIVLHMLPSHVEILEPTELKFQNFDLSSLLSNLTVKIHRYDEIAKAALMQNNILKKKLEEFEGKKDEPKENKSEKKTNKKKSSKKKTSKKK